MTNFNHQFPIERATGRAEAAFTPAVLVAFVFASVVFAAALL